MGLFDLFGKSFDQQVEEAIKDVCATTPGVSGLKADPHGPITVYSESLEYSHFKGPEYDRLLHTFIKEKYRSTPIGVIVADGFDALQFAVRLRTDLDPAIPIVFSNVDDGTATHVSLPPNTTGL